MKNIFLFLFIIKTSLVVSQAGSFDSTFDSDGKNTFCLPIGISNNNLDNGFQSTGKIINCLFDYTNPIFLIRWNIDGTLDTTFGSNGSQTYFNTAPFINGGYYPFRMAIQSDDRILIMGLQQNSTYPNAYWVARFLPNGVLDVSFDNDGYLDLSFGTQQDRGTCIAIQPNGKILVGGTSGDNTQYFSMARLENNGSLDLTFGTGGKVQTTFNDTQSWGNSIAIQNDGKIVFGGYTVNQTHGYDFGLIRYNNNGTIDTNFGTNGKVITTLHDTRSDILTKVIIQSDGKILAGGYTSSELNPRMAMVRYLSDGSLDTTFGSGGIVTSIGYGRTCSVAIQADGKYVLGGGGDADVFEVYRYHTNGAIDTAFGTNGMTNAFQSTGGYIKSVLIQSDNKIVACGSTASPDFNSACAAVIRLNPGTLGNDTFPNTPITVFPNPTSDTLYFDNSNHHYKSVIVYNYLGQEVAMKKLESLNEERIEMSHFASGVYLFKFTGEATNDIIKVVKK